MRLKGIVVGLLFAGVVSELLALTVREHHDTAVDFSKFKSFTLKTGTPSSNPFVQQRIELAITTNLTAKGLSAAAADADLFVYPHVKVDVSKVMDVSSFGYGGYYGWGGWAGDFGSTTVNVVDVPVGTLMVDLVDQRTKQLVWRGIAQDTIPANLNPDKSEKLINKAVGKLFREFPPAPPKK